MSILSNKKNYGNELTNVITEVATIISDQRGSLIGAESAQMVVGMESLQGNDLTQAQTTFENVESQLQAIGLSNLIKAQLGGAEGNSEVAMESAVLSLMASGDASAYHNAFANPEQGASTDAVIIEGNDEGIGSIMGMESFTSEAFNKFNAMSVVLGALSLAQTSFDELFFPTEIVAAGKSGAEVKVTIPYAFNRTKRANNGSAWDFEKKSLVHAIEDHTILESHTTDIYPYADAGANNDAYLVDVGVVGNETVVVDGVDVVTRPLIFGKEIDLLAVSAHPGLIGADEQDETDALEANINIGDVYIRVTNTAATPAVVSIFKINLSGTPGALFTRPSEGSTNDLTVNFNGTISLNSEMLDIASVGADPLGIHGLLGVTVSDDWSIELDTVITGSTNTERANIKMYANAIELGNAVTGTEKTQVAKSSTEYGDMAAAITVELIGYMPRARRMNANLRLKGIYIDNGEANKYFFPIAMGAPVSSAKPIDVMGGGATVEGLIRALRTRSSNTAVTRLIESEERISTMQRTGTTQTNASTIGSLFVSPTYMEGNLDVQNDITIRTTSGGIDDLRALIVDKISTMADRLALDSKYLSALENFVGVEKEYTVIIGTDPRIAGLIMRSGDERTLGFKHNFEIQSSLDLRMRGKIYISFQRKGKTLDALSYGVHLSQVAMVHEIANSSRGTGVVSEVVVNPRESHVNTLPILAKITIAGLDEWYSK